MKNYLPILLFSFLFIQTATSQEGVIYLENPSFEGTPTIGELGSELPSGWTNCGFQNETPPDVHLVEGNPFGVETLPIHGNTYLGLVVRENDTWERVSQKLSSSLQAGVKYVFNIYMARSVFYMSPTPTSNGQMFNYTSPCKLRIWGGDDYCQRQELLAKSSLVVNEKWLEYQLTLKPSHQYESITLEAFYDTPTLFPYNGNILLDHASNIIPIDSFQIDSSRVVEEDRLNSGEGYSEEEYIEFIRDDEKGNIIIGSDLTRFEFTEQHMGTEFKIVMYAENDSLAASVAGEAFERIAELEQIFSDYQEDSEVSLLSALSGTGRGTEVSEDLQEVLVLARKIAKESKGTFDFTVGALTKLWRRAFRQKEVPSQNEIEKALSMVGYKKVSVKKNRVIRILQPGLRLDFGGIAKGYAVDEVLKLLKKRGVPIALVEGGGDIAAGNPPPGKASWKVERAFYEEKELRTEFINIANQAIATSGDSYKYLEEDGKRYSHIIDPRTGYGITSKEIVSVVAPTCAEADAWATALSVEVLAGAYLKLKKNGFKIYFSTY